MGVVIIIELITKLRAKSPEKCETTKEILLVDHTVHLLEEIKQLKEFIEKNKEYITYERIKKEEFFTALCLAAFLHDLGKISYKYQKAFYGKEFDSQLQNFLKPIKEVDLRHEILSALWASILLDDNLNDKIKKWFPKIRTAVLLHHYNEYYIQEKDLMEIIVSYQEEIKGYLGFLKDNSNIFKNFIFEFLNKIKEYPALGDKAVSIINVTKFKERVEELLEKIREKDDDISDFAEFYKTNFNELDSDYKELQNKMKEWYDFFVFLGALRRCDYSASGDVHIEKGINLVEEFYKNLSERIKNSIGIDINKKIWQEKILNEKDSDNLILIAPTGSGKTEFALLWAAKRGKKLIYTLPLRVALNDLFWRFKSEDRGKPYFDREFVDILHSTSFIEYLRGESEGKDIDIEAKFSGAKILSSPLLLTTPDQIFLSSLKYYGFDKLLSVYPLSAIVIDEIQAYNPEMAAVMIKTLEMIKKLNGNLLIITATFPPYFEEFLSDYKLLDLKDIIEENIVSKNEIKNYSIKRHKIRLIDKSLFNYKERKNKRISELEIINLNESLDKGGLTFEELLNKKDKNILIIVNNVSKAVELFKKLEKEKSFKERLYLDNLPLLLHSRVIEIEKSKRISAIKEALKNGKKGMILITTQIVEASVDIDFDVLITEISPIDSQIQRWGRIYRNRGKEDYDGDANIYIFTKVEGDKGTKAIYDEKTIVRTIEILKGVKSKLLDYETERKLVNEVFKDELLKEYVNKIKKTFEWLKFYSAEKRSEAQKIFRNIAGIQVFVPDLPNENDEIYKALSDLLKESKDVWNMPFESSEEDKDSIVKMIKKRTGKSINKFEILKVLYEYSFNLPLFGFENKIVRYGGLKKDLFKGFYILNVENEQLNDIRKYGISNIKNVDIDTQLINQTEEYII